MVATVEAVSLIVQIQLQLNRTDVAVKEVAAARRWAQDSLLVNLAESWVGLRLVGSPPPSSTKSRGAVADLYTQGGDKYQQAFYVFEELAQAQATSSVRSLVGQAVSELHLGRTEEAQSALEQALQKEPGYADAIANLLVLNVITGKGMDESVKYVSALSRVCRLSGVVRMLTRRNRTLEKADPNHPLLVDLAEKSELFDKAATKYRAKVAAA